jgi:hypothetical protein
LVATNLIKNTVGASTNYSIYKSDEKTNGRTEEFDNAVYKRYTILDTQDDILNSTLTSNFILQLCLR